MPSWKKIITSGSAAILTNVTASSYTGSFTGSFSGTVTSASFASTSSFVNTLRQNLTITGSLNVSGSVNIIQRASFNGIDSGGTVSAAFTPIDNLGNTTLYSDTNLYLKSNQYTFFDSGFNTTMYLTNGGNLAIGPAAPLARVHIKGSGTTSGTTALLVHNANSSASLTVLDNGSAIITNGLTVTGSVIATSFTGSLLGTASFANTASRVNTLNQNVLITGSLTIGSGSLGSGENTLVVGLPPNGGTGEGGQILLSAAGGTYTSASMLDTYQDSFRVLRGTNTGSDAFKLKVDLHTGQVQIPNYNGPSAFSGTSAANLEVDSSGNIITTNPVTPVAGYTGIVTFPGNPPGQQNLDFQNGILINVF